MRVAFQVNPVCMKKVWLLYLSACMNQRDKLVGNNDCGSEKVNNEGLFDHSPTTTPVQEVLTHKENVSFNLIWKYTSRNFSFPALFMKGLSASSSS